MAPRRIRKEQEPAADQGDAFEPSPGEIDNSDFPPSEQAGSQATVASTGKAPPEETPAGSGHDSADDRGSHSDAGRRPWEERTQRVNPWDSIGYYWKDGYGIRYQEKENPRPRRSKAEIRFGDGSLKDKPQNFDKIKELLTAKGLTFVPEDRAWGIDFTRDTRGDVSDHVRAVLREVLKLEEEMRGPHTGERASEPGIQR